jgi:hypothetical protein
MTVAVNDGTFNYRNVKFFDVGTFAAFSSVAVDHTSTQNEVDALVGAAWATFGSVPTGVLAYFEANSTAPTPGQSFEVDAAASLIASSYLMIREVDTNDVAQATYSFHNLTWVQTDANAQTRANGQSVYWVTFTASLTGNGGGSVSITFAVSSVLGVLDLGSTPITPRSLETIIRIDNYNYQRNTNSLSLRVLVATGSGTVANVGSVALGGGLSKVYFELKNQAQIATSATVYTGNSVNVVINAWSDTSLTTYQLPQAVQTQLQSKFSGAWDVKTTDVKFPANTQHIIYDPTMASGPTPSSALALAPTALMMLLAVVAAMFLL